MAEIENSNCGNVESSRLTIVVLPEPLGAENMISLPCCILQNVKHLFLNLLQLVLHLYNQNLHVGLVCL